ncbi:phage portal protein family protein [Micromonospora sp. CA-248212]|uniref:phage portal protein family protein n=1 Tax=Micromonospora sp. CA-248212 TaxID=3239961 RepID=UPI003D8F6F29
MMTAPTSLVGSVNDFQFGSIVTDVYEHIPALLYPNSVQVYAEMRRDSRLTSILDGYGLQLRRAQWQLDGSGCRPEVTQFVADCLGLNVVGVDKASGARRRGVSWNDHLRSALLSQVWGHYGFEMEAAIDSDGRARLTTLAERIPATITTIHADPKTGALLGIDQLITARDKSPQIEADRLVFYSRNREGNGWQGTSLIRAAYAPWLLKREMLRVAAISNRRWGAGVPVAQALPGTNPTTGQMQEAQRLASAARAGDQAGASMPPGFKLDIVGLSGSIPDTLGFIRFLNQEIAQSALMPHLDLGNTETGSRALGTVFLDSWTLALESEAEAIADTITRQGAARIVDWNWGEDEPVPRVVVSGIGSRREVTAESLQLLLSSGALAADPGLEAWVRREYRLPEREGAPAPAPTARGGSPRRPEPTEVTAAAAPPPTVDAQGLSTDHAETVTEVTEGWAAASGPLVAALSAAVAAEVVGGALAGLSALAVPTAAVSSLAGVVTAGLVDVAEKAARRAAVEAAGAALVANQLSDDARDRLADLGRATTDLIVAGYQSAASRVALGLAGADGKQVKAAVTDALADLSQAKTSGLVAGHVSAAVGTAQGVGREDVFYRLPAGTRFKVSEVNDRARCGPCREADNQEFPSLTAALKARPTGRHPKCEGRDRCRGFFYPITD